MNTNDKINQIYELLSFDQKDERAVAYGLNINNEDSNYRVIGEDGDIYQLIENLKVDKFATNFDFVSIITYGWAAPIQESVNQDIPPSQANGRRRVRLMIVAEKASAGIIGSALNFKDNDEVIYDDNVATGPLRDAFDEIYG